MYPGSASLTPLRRELVPLRAPRTIGSRQARRRKGSARNQEFTTALAYLLLGIAQLGGLALSLGGWPGAWVQLAGLGLFAWWYDFQPVGTVPLGILAAMALLAEILGPILGAPSREPALARRVRKAGFLGAALGALAGNWTPLVGTATGTLVGAALATLAASMRGWSREQKLMPALAFALAVSIRMTSSVLIAAFATFGLVH